MPPKKAGGDRPLPKRKQKQISKYSGVNIDPTELAVVVTSMETQHYKRNETSFSDATRNGAKNQTGFNNDEGMNDGSMTASKSHKKAASLPSMITVKKTSAVISHQTSLTMHQGIHIDMSLTQITEPNFRHIIRQGVKLQVFRRCKFYQKDYHGHYCEKENSFCGIIMKYCNVVAGPEWWYKIRGLVVKTHTDHRNNCIKAMRLKFRGKKMQNMAVVCCLSNIEPTNIYFISEGSSKPTPSQPFVMPNHNLHSGCEDEHKYMLEMRSNVCHYCAILDMYAPCIVSFRLWNNDANMNKYCCTTDSKLFGKHVLSISDEAFLLLVLLNSAARWMAEIKRDRAMVSKSQLHLSRCKSNLVITTVI